MAIWLKKTQLTDGGQFALKQNGRTCISETLSYLVALNSLKSSAAERPRFYCAVTYFTCIESDFAFVEANVFLSSWSKSFMSLILRMYSKDRTDLLIGLIMEDNYWSYYFTWSEGKGRTPVEQRSVKRTLVNRTCLFTSSGFSNISNVGRAQKMILQIKYKSTTVVCLFK